MPRGAVLRRASGLDHPRQIEKIVITREVRDMDNPTKPPVSVD
jgi:hypothetical protein